MKNQVYRVIAIIGIFFGLAAAAQAQTASKVEVNIPFEFSAGKATLKAGAYSLKWTSGNLFTLRNLDDHSTVIVNAPGTLDSRDENAGARLVFNKYEDKLVLAQIWLTAETGRQVFVRGLEGTKKPERVELSLRL